MSWSPDTQNRGGLRGANFEWGEATLDTDGTVEVYTQLAKVQSYFAAHKYVDGDTNAIAATPIYCDLVITSGCVTFTDPAADAHSGVTICYGLIGE